jgi:hypothetical protein
MKAMQDDIVTRLRIVWHPSVGLNHERQEAADEIERLREELRKYTGDGHVPIEPFTPEAL